VGFRVHGLEFRFLNGSTSFNKEEEEESGGTAGRAPRAGPAPLAGPGSATPCCGWGVWGLGFWVFKAHRLAYHSTLGSRVIKKKKVLGAGVETWWHRAGGAGAPGTASPFLPIRPRGGRALRLAAPPAARRHLKLPPFGHLTPLGEARRLPRPLSRSPLSRPPPPALPTLIYSPASTSPQSSSKQTVSTHQVSRLVTGRDQSGMTPVTTPLSFFAPKHHHGLMKTT